MSPSATTTLIFILVLLLYTCSKLYLATRQIRAVAAHRAQVPAAFAGAIALRAHQRAADYTLSNIRFGMLDLLFSGLVLLAWTLLGGLDALNIALLSWLGPRPMLQPLALLISFAVISALIDMPAALYRTFVIEQRHGFNRMSWRLWLADLLRASLLGLLLGVPLAWCALWLMQATGALWWLWTWAAWMAFSLLMLIIYPMFIAPLFNRFEPLDDPSLVERIRQLMQRCGFSAKGLFVMDGSRRSAHANAYFTGFGAAKRVVFFDTLLKKLSPDEVEAVLAHELGHYKRHHIIQRIALMAVMSLLGLALLGYLVQQQWFYTGLGVTPNLPVNMGGLVPNYALALLLFLMVTPLFSFFLSPWMSALSRKHEFEADSYAASHAQADHLIQALVKLLEDNASTLTPDPLYVSFYYSHPPAGQRIAHLEHLQQSAT